jgi:hypothetical protein
MTRSRPFGKLIHQGAQIGLYRGTDIGIDHGCAGALVLAHLRQYVDRQRNETIRERAAEDFAYTPLMVWIGIGMQQTDGNGLDLLSPEPHDHVLHAGDIEGCDHVAAVIDAF